MIRVEFEDALTGRNILPGSPLQARERRYDPEGVGDQASRVIRSSG